MSSSTPRVQRLRKRRNNGVLMSCFVEVGELGLELLIKNRLLGPHEKSDRKAIQAAVSAALHQWSNGRGSRATVH